MDINTDKNVITAFALGVVFCAALLSPIWLFGGISEDDAATIVLEKIYSDVGRENNIVEVISAQKSGDGLFKVDVSVREITAAKNITYLVTKEGKVLLDESEDIEGQKDEGADGSGEGVEATSSGKTVDGVHIKGQSDAKVTIIEYSDFQCPYCARYYNDAYQQILSTYPSDVKIIFKHFPLSFHAQAVPAAEASECAGAQGKFWEFHDTLFENQNEWSNAGRTAFDKYAEELDLDMASFATCVDNREFKAKVEADFIEGQQKGVRGTPAFLINDKLVTGAQPFSTFKSEIDAALAAAL